MTITGCWTIHRGRHRRERISGAALAVVVALVATEGCDSSVRPPNVILLSVDTLNPDVLLDPAAPETPAIDSLASRSARFRNAYSTSGWTLPATASILTGTYPDRHALHNARATLAATSIAQLLGGAGYETAAFTDGGYVNARYLGAGFARYDDLYTGTPGRSTELPRDGKGADLRGSKLFDRAIAFLDRRQRDRPFFLFLQTYAVHDYFKVHPWAVQATDPFEDREDESYVRCLLGRESCTSDETRRVEQLYHAELPNLDAGVARLDAAIRRNDYNSDTIVVFVSDHGEGFDFAGGRFHHGGRLHRDLLHVPLFISGPQIVSEDVKVPVSLVDLMPTLLELVGQQVPPDLDGASLKQVVRQPSAELAPRPIYAMEHRFFWQDGRRRAIKQIQTTPLQVAVIDGNGWYIRGRDSGTEAWGHEELYDVFTDPEQTVELSTTSMLLPDLRSLVERRLQRPPPTQSERPLDSSTLEQLRSLGYLE